MGTGSAKKTPSKRRSVGQERHSPSKTLKMESTPPSAKRTPRDTNYSHVLPTDDQRKGNGRVSGRSLIMWSRPRMAEKLLLHLHFECMRHKVNIPWDAVAHRLHPGSSGAAVLQHVNRLRKELVAEGHLVPPVAQKGTGASQFDPSVRGYVRTDPTGDDKLATRPVRFDEKLEDPKFNLPDAFNLPEEDEEQGIYESDCIESGDEIEPPQTPTPMRRVSRSSRVTPYKTRTPARGRFIEPEELQRASRSHSGPKRNINLRQEPRMMIDDDGLFGHPFEDRRPLPVAPGEVRSGAKAQGSPEYEGEAYLHGYPAYPQYDRPWHPSFYHTGHNGYYPYPPHPAHPPHSPREAEDEVATHVPHPTEEETPDVTTSPAKEDVKDVSMLETAAEEPDVHVGAQPEEALVSLWPDDFSLTYGSELFDIDAAFDAALETYTTNYSSLCIV